MNYAVIPARGGSKRIPRKNIKSFCGIPMLGRAIITLKNTKAFERIFVSTEDKEIAELAKSYGAEVPSLRRHELADDFTGLDAVMQSFCEENHANLEEDSTVVSLLPCSPLITSNDLVDFLEIHKNNRNALVYPVAKFPSNPERALIRKSGNEFLFHKPENRSERSQDLPEYFFDAGQFYIATAEVWKSVAYKKIVGKEVDRFKAIDIDDLSDWIFAELVFQAIQKASRENFHENQ